MKSSMNSNKNTSVSSRSFSVKKKISPSLNESGTCIVVGSKISNPSFSNVDFIISILSCLSNSIISPNPDFAQLKTLLRNPRIGDNILYRVGAHDVYFIPVYTAGAGGVVAQLGTIAAVGAAFTGEYYVGLGNTQEEAFEAYLQKVSGVIDTKSGLGEIIELERQDRIDIIKSTLENEGLEILEPTTIQVPLSFNEGEIFFFTEKDREDTEVFLLEFIDDFVKPRSERVFLWEEENQFNVGTIVVRDGIPEMHYISIEVGV